MTATFQRHFKLNGRWGEFFENLPSFDYGIAVRRGGVFLTLYPEAELSIEDVARYIADLDGSKIIFSDDLDYRNELRDRVKCPASLDMSGQLSRDPDRYICEFLTLSKCRTSIGSKRSSFARIAAIFGGAKYIEI